MLNRADTVPVETLHVLEGVELQGQVNVSDEGLLANVRSALRRQHPQVRPHPPNMDRVALVGSGPSLAATERELVDLLFDGRTRPGRSGTKLVTVNGAYHWCLERNLQPSMQIIMDARASNARFLEPAVPNCIYMLSSQCAPEAWDAVEGRPDVYMFHSAVEEGPIRDAIDAHFLGQWFGVGGGTTVTTRAINLLRMLGYIRFDLFGIDSCWLGGQHHAFEQPENETDRRLRVWVSLADRPEDRRPFLVSRWHLKQLEDFLQLIRVNGDHFVLNLHGEGLLAHALKSAAAAEFQVEEDEALVPARSVSI